MLAVVEHRDLFAGEDGLGEFEQRHVRPAPGAIDGKEAQTGRRQVVEMAVGMGHQLIGFLAGGVETQRMVNVVMHREGHRGVGAIHAGTAGIDEVLDAVVAAAFEDMGETDDVAVDVGERVFDGIAHAGLGGKIHHALRLVGGETRFHGLAVGNINTQVSVVRMVGVTGQTGFLDGRVVVVVVVVDADDAIAAIQQAQGKGRADETGSASDEYLHIVSFLITSTPAISKSRSPVQARYRPAKQPMFRITY